MGTKQVSHFKDLFYLFNGFKILLVSLIQCNLLQTAANRANKRCGLMIPVTFRSAFQDGPITDE